MSHRAGQVLCLFLVIFVAGIPAIAIDSENVPGGRFDHRTQPRIGGNVATRGTPVSSLAASDPLRQEWERIAAEYGKGWRVWLDDRSGFPSLTLVPELRWPSDDLDSLAAAATRFLRDHESVLGAHGDQLGLDHDASGKRGPNVWQIRLAQVVNKVTVEGAHYDFNVVRGKLVAFGARSLAPVRISTVPGLGQEEARKRLDAYVRPTAADGIVELDSPELVLLPLDADPSSGGAWQGVRGAGLTHRLIWRFRFTDVDAMATWTGEVDAHTGEIVSFFDDTRYSRVKGHVFPISSDGQCDIGGCQEPDYPMPFVDYSVNEGPLQYTNSFGLYSCETPGEMVATELSGKYFKIDDQCGPIFENTTCDTDLDLGVGQGSNCNAPAGASSGNTDAARSAYYSLNLVNRKARFWMPGNSWLENEQIECRTNVPATCNALYQSGKIHMFQAGDGCANTAEIQGVVVHEWGHGLNFFDGGTEDSPSEAYSDIIAMLEARDSCLGRGFLTSGTCTGFGDTCLSCTGAREMDWDARIDHMPATPTGFLSTYCESGTGPCGKREHCESYLASEAFYDLATRDLPAAGVDVDTAWQLVERLWYQSRPGSGGPAYNCALPDSDSCSVGSWYHQLRVQDDDDGDLSNGTPHAAAIFAAFDRHDIACGGSGDPENLSSTSCPSLEAPVVFFTAHTGAVELHWNAIQGASTYRIYRNEIACDRGQFPVADIDAGTLDYLDDGIANGFPVYYRVQAIGANAACESPVSTCVEAAAQEFAGSVRFSQGAYACDAEIGLEVNDLNHPSASVTVSIWSDTETAPETVILTETSPGTARFSGSIPATTALPATDGLLSIKDGDTITAEYVDLDDGEGGFNVVQRSQALADCAGPVHTTIVVRDITDNAATIDWTTSQPVTGHLEWGLTAALGNVIPTGFPSASHSVQVGPFSPCDRIHFRVVSTDLAGNTTIADVDGTPFEFNAYKFQSIFADGFETDTGWTLDGDWQIDVPQGLGTAPGDPSSASEGVRVLGQDLTGLGTSPGDYEAFTTYSATSPVIDASGLTSVELRFDRWLNHETNGESFVYAKDATGIWRTVWSETGATTESSWSEQFYDVSQWAAGNPSFQVRFTQSARLGRDAGWNIDRLHVRDSSLATFVPCGGCAGTPTFAGAMSATDDDPCADSPVTVTWATAPAWGTGGGGTYSIYRDTVPDFTPSGANLVASGIVTTSWVDAGPPSDIPLYYIVRAENDETCGAGPNNAGTVDANLHRVVVTNTTGQSLPESVGNTLTVNKAYGTDVRMGWSAVSGATGHRVYRSSVPDTEFAIVGQPTEPIYQDVGALVDGLDWYYLVTATNACGGESPN